MVWSLLPVTKQHTPKKFPFRFLALQESKDHKDLRAYKERKVLLVIKVQQEVLVIKDLRDQRDREGCKVLQGLLEYQDRKGRRVLKDLQDQSDHQDLKVNKASKE
jgi:hypothetical protein